MDVEPLLQRKIVEFCSSLPAFIDNWQQQTLKESVIPTRGLYNQVEQLHHVERVEYLNINNFDEIKLGVRHKIIQGIEEDIVSINKVVDQLNKLNADLKNKLVQLESFSSSVNWKSSSVSISGGPTQPSFALLLSLSYDFYTFFAEKLNDMKCAMKSIKISGESTVKALQELFAVDFNRREITKLIAITQYVK